MSFFSNKARPYLSLAQLADIAEEERTSRMESQMESQRLKEEYLSSKPHPCSTCEDLYGCNHCLFGSDTKREVEGLGCPVFLEDGSIRLLRAMSQKEFEMLLSGKTIIGKLQAGKNSTIGSRNEAGICFFVEEEGAAYALESMALNWGGSDVVVEFRSTQPDELKFGFGTYANPQTSGWDDVIDVLEAYLPSYSVNGKAIEPIRWFWTSDHECTLEESPPVYAWK